MDSICDEIKIDWPIVLWCWVRFKLSEKHKSHFRSPCIHKTYSFRLLYCHISLDWMLRICAHTHTLAHSERHYRRTDEQHSILFVSKHFLLTQQFSVWTWRVGIYTNRVQTTAELQIEKKYFFFKFVIRIVRKQIKAKSLLQNKE